jgi:hypothetical protein
MLILISYDLLQTTILKLSLSKILAAYINCFDTHGSACDVRLVTWLVEWFSCSVSEE